MKKCSKCKQERPKKEFSKSKRESDGLQYYCKSCSKKHSIEYVKANQEKEKARSRKYNQTNREKRIEGSRKYYQNNKEKLLKYSKQRYKINKEKRNRQSAEWRHLHPEQNAATQKSYKQNNRDKYRLHTMNRRALQKGAEGICTLEQEKELIDLYNGLCYIPGCGELYDAIDHVVPLSKGGTNWPSNLRPICKSCNSRKGVKPLSVFLKKLNSL